MIRLFVDTVAVVLLALQIQVNSSSNKILLQNGVGDARVVWGGAEKDESEACDGMKPLANINCLLFCIKYLMVTCLTVNVCRLQLYRSRDSSLPFSSSCYCCCCSFHLNVPRNFIRHKTRYRKRSYKTKTQTT